MTAPAQRPASTSDADEREALASLVTQLNDLKARALEEAADEIVRTGPGANAELRYDGTPDPGMAGYVEGLRDAWSLLRARAARLREQGGAQ